MAGGAARGAVGKDVVAPALPGEASGCRAAAGRCRRPGS